jgi:hypothetical protein
VLGYYALCTHPKIQSLFKLCKESLAPSPVKLLDPMNYCPVPGTLINTNNMSGFQNLDVVSLLREEGKKVHCLSSDMRFADLYPFQFILFSQFLVACIVDPDPA